MNVRMVFALLVLGAAALAGCAGGASPEGGVPNAVANAPNYEENAVIHKVAQEDIDATHGKGMVPAGTSVLWVNGLGCPQCASNIDLVLEKLPGVNAVRVDLGEGKVYVTTAGSRRPSPQRFSDAVTDAGFTLVKVENK